jgi:regulator of replication initiation timing
VLLIDKEWEGKLAHHTSSLVQKQTAKIKKLEEDLAERAAKLERLEDSHRKSEQENASLRAKLSSAVSKLDDLDNGDEHVILRKQLDSLLKEKTSLCIENSELKIKLAKYESVDQYPTASSKKQPPTDSAHKTPKRVAAEAQAQAQASPVAKSIDTMATPLSEEDSELRNKVISYFGKKYPDMQLVQVNRSSLG